MPLETADIVPSLQTGLIEATPAPPVFALATQIDLLDRTPAFQGIGGPKPMIEAPKGGTNVLIGVGVYTKATFRPNERYGIWTMQSGFHTLLPTVDGVMQAAGREFAARDVSCEVTGEAAALSLDMAPAYPQTAGIQSWKRRIVIKFFCSAMVPSRKTSIHTSPPARRSFTS